MPCKACGSENRPEFGAEANVHIAGASDLKNGAVLIFPKLVVCLDCGFVEFTLAENELRRLQEGRVA
jgi:hypothetical protein